MVVNIKEFAQAFINQALINNYFRMLIMLMCSVLVGYTLQPVPQWLSDLFDTSNVFKFIILVLAGITAVYPLNGDELYYVIFGAIFILMLLSVLRKYDKKKTK